MASPLVVGTTVTVVAPVNRRRADIRFQNTSATQTVYLKKIPLTGTTTAVSTTDYEIRLLPDSATDVAGEAFITNSIASFMAIATAAAGSLAVYETVKA